MARRRFFVPSENIRSGSALLPPEQAHHLRDVLRLDGDDEVELIDDAGAAYAGRVELHQNAVLVIGLRVIASNEPVSAKLVLAPALIRSEKFAWMLQKATELGVNEIVPLVTLRCEVRLAAEKLEGRVERWQRIVREAAKQSRLLSIPSVRLPMSFSEFVAPKDDSASCDRLLFYEDCSDPWDATCLRGSQTVLCVGPEGGWDASEIEMALRSGFTIFGLGPRILRAETASLVAVTLIQFAKRRH